MTGHTKEDALGNNTRLEHSVGGLLLQAVAERLTKCAREQDTVARLGGDKFLIVLTNQKDIPDAAIAAERFMDAMTAEFVIQGHSLALVAASASIGEWVLRTACSQARKWQDEGLTTVSVAVNVSAVQFRQEDFLNTNPQSASRNRPRAAITSNWNSQKASC
jgi:diguanylate cyclase (GGDEF)-like protein